MNEYNTSELHTFGYSMSFMLFMAKAEARYLLEVVLRTQHKAIYSIGEGVLGHCSMAITNPHSTGSI